MRRKAEKTVFTTGDRILISNDKKVLILQVQQSVHDRVQLFVLFKLAWTSITATTKKRIFLTFTLVADDFCQCLRNLSSIQMRFDVFICVVWRKSRRSYAKVNRFWYLPMVNRMTFPNESKILEEKLTKIKAATQFIWKLQFQHAMQWKTQKEQSFFFFNDLLFLFFIFIVHCFNVIIM